MNQGREIIELVNSHILSSPSSRTIQLQGYSINSRKHWNKNVIEITLTLESSEPNKKKKLSPSQMRRNVERLKNYQQKKEKLNSSETKTDQKEPSKIEIKNTADQTTVLPPRKANYETCCFAAKKQQATTQTTASTNKDSS